MWPIGGHNIGTWEVVDPDDNSDEAIDLVWGPEEHEHIVRNIAPTIPRPRILRRPDKLPGWTTWYGRKASAWPRRRVVYVCFGTVCRIGSITQERFFRAREMLKAMLIPLRGELPTGLTERELLHNSGVVLPAGQCLEIMGPVVNMIRSFKRLRLLNLEAALRNLHMKAGVGRIWSSTQYVHDGWPYTETNAWIYVLLHEPLFGTKGVYVGQKDKTEDVIERYSQRVMPPGVRHRASLSWQGTIIPPRTALYEVYDPPTNGDVLRVTFSGDWTEGSGTDPRGEVTSSSLCSV